MVALQLDDTLLKKQINNQTIRNVLLLLFAYLVLAVQDVVIKLMSGNYALLQIVLIRTLFTLPMVLGILRYRGGLRLLRTKSLGLELLRGFAMFMAYLFFFTALSVLPYSTVMALFFSAPLFITALSVPLLGEVVKMPRWVAVTVGFVGVLIIVDPRGTTFDFAMLFAVAAALAYSISLIITRKLDDSSAAITVYTIGVYLVAALILSPIAASVDPASTHPAFEFLVRSWPSMPLRDIALVALTSVCWGIGMVLLSAAYRETAVAILAPFEYFSIVYGLLFGFLIWQERPTPQMLLGLGLIVGSGLFIIYRENQTE